jgi:hypothetical protein
MVPSFRSTLLPAAILFIVFSLAWPCCAYGEGRKDIPKSDVGEGPELFATSPVNFAFDNEDGITVESRVRCEKTAPSDCLPANAIFAYFYVVTIGSKPITHQMSITIIAPVNTQGHPAPFDTHNSANLHFGILDELDAQGNGTKIVACSSSACIDGALATSSTDVSGLRFDLDPTSLSTGQFAPGDQIYLYATSFSPPPCKFDLDLSNVLSCSQSTSVTGLLDVVPPIGVHSISPGQTPILVPVLPTAHKIVAPAEESYFRGASQFSGNSIDAQAIKGATITPLSAFVSSRVDILDCNFCNGIANVSYGYIYDVRIPTTVNISSLPSTLTIALGAPYNREGFEFLNFGVLGTDGPHTSSRVATCPADPNAYNACLNTIVDAKIQPTNPSLTFTINTANLSPGDNLELFATSNEKPSSCSSTTSVCVSSTPITLAGDSVSSLSLSGSSPTTVPGPSDPIPVPVIRAVQPTQTGVGGTGFPLTVKGPNAPGSDVFIVGSQFLWNGSPRQTQFISPTEIRGQVLTSDLQSPATVTITVFNPPNPSTTITPNGGLSGPATYKVVQFSPVPNVTSISPTSALVGGPAFTLTVNGTGFISSSQVTFNGNPKVTTLVSSTQLTASIPAADIAVRGTYVVTVVNPGPAPGGGPAINSANFSVVSKSPTVESLSPTSGKGLIQTFTISIADTNGLADLRNVDLLFAGAMDASGPRCKVVYLAATNQLDLYADNNINVLGPLTPGTAGTVANSQCALNAMGSSASKAGNNLTLRVALTFNPSFTGLKNAYVSTTGVTGAGSGPTVKGTWIPAPAAPHGTIDSGGGSGLVSTLGVHVTDAGGVADLRTVHLLISTTSANQANACSIYYVPSSNQLFLYADNGKTLLGPLGLGTAEAVANSQCTLNASGSSVTKDSFTLDLAVALRFKPAFEGEKLLYSYSATNSGINTGWVVGGGFTVVPVPPTFHDVTPGVGTGIVQTFTEEFFDRNGPTALRSMHLSFSTTSANQASACSVYYVPRTNQLYLYADNGITLLGPVKPALGFTPGSGLVLNSQCTLNGAGSSFVVEDGPPLNLVALSVALRFKPTFTGAKNIYVYAADTNGTHLGWQFQGTWTPAP